MAQDDDSNDDYAKLAENTKSDDVAFVGCLFWVLSFILTPFFYFKGIAYFSDVVYPAGFWAAAIVP